jgi:hypothetical protein
MNELAQRRFHFKLKRTNMNNFKKGLKRKSLKENVEINNPINSFIHPFKEMPSSNNRGKESADRINAHELFSLYTADIIKEDIIFTR